jgi:2OG-Fe(II) oxygenase superfamily
VSESRLGGADVDAAPRYGAAAAPRPTAPDFIQGYPGALAPALCEEIVVRFEADDRKYASRTATRLNPLVRSGTMLDIPRYPEWADVCRTVTQTTRRCLDDYARRYPSLQSLAQPERSLITPPIIERIEPGQGYGYHIDAGPGGTHDRLVSGLIYLRDVPEGGETEFPFQQMNVRPRAGLLLLFPPFWTHLHRGVSPASAVKYNITNFVVIRPPVPARA